MRPDRQTDRRTDLTPLIDAVQTHLNIWNCEVGTETNVRVDRSSEHLITNDLACARRCSSIRYPVRQAEVGLSVCRFQTNHCPLHRYICRVFSAADKVFPQISNLECKTVPVTDPNAFTLSCHYCSFPVHSSGDLFELSVTLHFRQSFHNKTKHELSPQKEPSWEAICSSVIQQTPTSY